MATNKFMSGLKNESNYTYTENGALTYKSTLDGLLDLFALGGAYRTRSDADIVNLFQKAFVEDELHALRCLFYLRDILQGQGERRFFRVCCRWLAREHTDALKRNLIHIPEFGRWDDLIYITHKTSVWNDAIAILKKQIAADILDMKKGNGISLLGKWLPSENTSSQKTREIANAVRASLGMNHREYRKVLSGLRAHINVLERLMSAGKWDEIEFDKIPSKAGFKYRNAFARHDIERMKQAKEPVVSYEEFAKDKNTKVNAKAMYPYEVVAEAFKLTRGNGYSWSSQRNRSNIPLDNTERLVINKYWQNLEDYFKGASLDALCVIDTSGSMWGTEASAPINVAISIGLYCAEKAKGPFAGHYISFSSRPQLIETEGVDFCDKVERIYRTNLCENTNIEATFDMLLNTALRNKCSQSDLPKSIIIVSDMEFDAARGGYGWGYGSRERMSSKETLMEGIKRKWETAGYEMPNLIFWCVQSRQDNIPMKVENGISMVSGFSPVLFQQIMEGKSAYDLMLAKLDSERYACIH